MENEVARMEFFEANIRTGRASLVLWAEIADVEAVERHTWDALEEGDLEAVRGALSLLGDMQRFALGRDTRDAAGDSAEMLSMYSGL